MNHETNNISKQIDDCTTIDDLISTYKSLTDQIMDKIGELVYKDTTKDPVAKNEYNINMTLVGSLKATITAENEEKAIEIANTYLKEYHPDNNVTISIAQHPHYDISTEISKTNDTDICENQDP